MKLEGTHGNLNFRIENEENDKRLGIYTQDRGIYSIAVKVYGNSENQNLSFIDKVKMSLRTAFSWKWAKADDNTLININSLARHTGLTKEEIRTSAREGTLTETIVSKCEELAAREAAAKEQKVALFKQHPVNNRTAHHILSDAAALFMDDKTIEEVSIYWSSNEVMLASGRCKDKPYVNRSELNDTYMIPAQVYKEDRQLYLLLDDTQMTHIEAREFRNGTLATWTGPAPSEEKKQQIREEVVRYISYKELHH